MTGFSLSVQSVFQTNISTELFSLQNYSFFLHSYNNLPSFWSLLFFAALTPVSENELVSCFSKFWGHFQFTSYVKAKAHAVTFLHVWIVEEPIIQIYVLYLGQSCCAYTIATADWPRTHAPQQTGRYGASHMICLRNYCWEVADKFSLQRWDPE